MADTQFPITLLQAINDWQIGGNAKQKATKGRRLKEEAASLPGKFREAKGTCYRQIAIQGDSLYKLNDQLELLETISAWTSSLTSAEQIKDGVPPQDYQGIIFALTPPPKSVIINLDRLYGNKQFIKAVAKAERQIVRFGDGIGRFRNTQREVVLELPKIRLSDVFSLGGYSNSREKLAQMYYQKDMLSFLEYVHFDELMKKANAAVGPHWISGASKDRCIKRIQAKAPEYRTIKQLHDLAAAEDQG